jgi:hypothetical protein
VLVAGDLLVMVAHRDSHFSDDNLSEVAGYLADWCSEGQPAKSYL